MTAWGDVITTADAARVLAVSTRQARRLVSTGVLLEAGRVGGTVLVDAKSVHRLAARGGQPGRPWSEHVAWAAIDLLETGDTDRVTTAQRSRLRTRMRDISALEFVRFTRRRADTRRYRAAGTFPKRIQRMVTRTGAAAVASNRATAGAFDLALGGTGDVDGYVERRLLNSYIEEFFLVPDHNGNVTLRATDHACQHLRLAPTSVVALDLTDSLDPREHAAGLRMLDHMLDGL